MDQGQKVSETREHESSRLLSSSDHAEIEPIAAASEADDDSEVEASADGDSIPIVTDAIPSAVWLITAIEAGERFAYFGILGPLQNYIEFPASGGPRPGGLGMGQRIATLAKLLFTIWCYITPIVAAVIADQYWGRYRTVLYSTIPYFVGLVVLTCSATFVNQETSVVPSIGLAIAMIAIGIGTGGIKANVSSLAAEQYQPPEGRRYQIQNGQKALVSHDATIQRIFLFFYTLINLGAFGAMVTAALEQKYGFVTAYGLTLLVFILATLVLVRTGRRYRRSPPTGSVVPNIIKILRIANSTDFNLHNAKPENLSHPPPWDAQMVEDVRQAISACHVFVFFPTWWCGYIQMLTNLISQAGTMRTGSIPNDVLPYTNAAMVIILAPLFNLVLYPMLNRRGINFSPTRRITAGFFFCALAMVYTTILQSRIYASPPCYNHPLSKSCQGGQVGNDISVLWQLPIYILISISEILAAATGLEFAYESAPRSMKSLVTALFLVTNPAGMGLAMAFEGLARDPLMIWHYGGVTIEVLLGFAIFCYTFRYSIITGKEVRKVVDR